MSDAGSEVIRRYGILNPVPEWAFGENADDPAVQADIATFVSVVGPREMMIGMAFPGTFMLDTAGRVTSRYFENSYIERNTVSSIVIRVGEAEVPVRAAQLAMPQLKLTTYASEATIAPGNRFALMFDIEPNPGMHVYAPGAADYRVVGVEVESDAPLLVLPMSYPASTDYYFEPFDETVPVYLEPFSLVQEIVLDGSLEAQAALRDQATVTISGTFTYQACSDEICYPPEELDLGWTIPLRALVFR